MSGNGRNPPEPTPEPPDATVTALDADEDGAIAGPGMSVTARQLGCFIVAAAVILAVIRALRRRPPAGD